MIVLKGKYNQANIFIDQIDKTTEDQIRTFLNHPAFQKTYIAIMPDCHAGTGSCIGFTMKMNDYIIPNIVGVDIGCGIDTYCLGKVDVGYQALHDFLKANIPTGFNIRAKEIKFLPIDIDRVKRVSSITNQDFNRVVKSYGTLGGGNHFIEVDEDNIGRKWLTIHSGSRGFGNNIAKYHQNIAKEYMKDIFHEGDYTDLEFLLGEDASKYLNDMVIAQNYAECNRWYIADIILANFFNQNIRHLESVKSVHNYIDLENKIIRKGAISAQEGERCIIPFDMSEGIAVCKGKGNAKYNYSAPHGAGRIMSRTEAKRVLSLDKFKDTMRKNNVWSATVNEQTLDEAPEAYKDKQVILDNIKEAVIIEFMMKPVFSFKDDTKKRRRKKR